MRAEQIELLYENARATMLASVVAGLALFFVFIDVAPLPVLAAWLGTFGLITGIRFLLVNYYFRNPTRQQQSDFWHSLFIITTATAGLVWGITGIWLIPLSLDENTRLLYTCMAVLFVSGLSAGALSTYSIKLSGYFAFVIPSLLPMALFYMASDNPFQHTVSLLMLIFLATLLLLAFRSNRSLLVSLQKTIDYGNLLRELEAERDRAREMAARMQTLSISDSLTGIANRRQFDEFLEREWQRAIRLCEPLSLVLGDLDYFKHYNDRYGHQMGDECLRQVAQILARHCRRPSDLAARYGGEEFAVILPNTDAKAAHKMIDRMRSDIESLEIIDPNSEMASSTTMSFGIATVVPRRDDAITTLINDTDKALYLAKANGRNCIVNNTIDSSEQSDETQRIHVRRWDEQLDGPLTLDNAIEQFSSRGYLCLLNNFNPDPDTPVGMHAHLREEINLILDGEILITVGERQYRLSRGEYLVMPSKVPHQATVSGNKPVQMLVAVREQADNRLAISA